MNLLRGGTGRPALLYLFSFKPELFIEVFKIILNPNFIRTTKRVSNSWNLNTGLLSLADENPINRVNRPVGSGFILTSVIVLCLLYHETTRCRAESIYINRFIDVRSEEHT